MQGKTLKLSKSPDKTNQEDMTPLTFVLCSEEDSVEEYFIAPPKHKNGVVSEQFPSSEPRSSY